MKSRFLAEAIGSFSIVATVLGAGFMVSSLGADLALGLFMIASSVAAVLFVVISTLAPISGAHFNPLVTIAFCFRKEQSLSDGAAYFAAQFLGAGLGAIAANSMFNQAIALSEVSRFSFGAMFGETIASAGLVFLVLQLVDQKRETLIAPAVAVWIFTGHIFTSSTSFANPAVTFGRMFSLSPSSISVESAGYFVLAQILGLILALFVSSQFRKVFK